MFQPDPDVLTSELAGVWMKELNCDAVFFIPRMNRYYDSEEDMTKGREGKEEFPLKL